MDEFTAQELIQEFVAEALESLRGVPRLLAQFRQTPTEIEAIHAAFRALHSIKGTAACLGLDAYKVFAHGLENVLAQIRDGKTPLSEAVGEVLIEGIDHLEGMLRSAAEGTILQELASEQQALLARLHSFLPADGKSASGQPSTGQVAESIQADLEEILRPSGDCSPQPPPRPQRNQPRKLPATSQRPLGNPPQPALSKKLRSLNRLPKQKILRLLPLQTLRSAMSGSKKPIWTGFSKTFPICLLPANYSGN